MKKYVSFVFAVVSFFMLTTSAFALNFVSPEEFKLWIENKKSIIILDIQPPDEYAKHHFKGSIATYASPVKTEGQKKKLDAVIPMIMTSEDDVVIIRYGGRLARIGSYNTFDYLKLKGIPENRIYILEGGISDWPYQEMILKSKKYR